MSIYLGNPNVVMGKGTVAVLITSGHARAMARAGLSKADVAAEIWARSSIPLERFPPSAHAEPPYEFVLRDGKIARIGEKLHGVPAIGRRQRHMNRRRVERSRGTAAEVTVQHGGKVCGRFKVG